MAPARIAPLTETSFRTLVSAMTSTSGSSAQIASVTAIPSITGIKRSIRTTSGSSSRAILSASSPYEVSPTTSNSGSNPKNMRSPWRTTPWSSVIKSYQDLYRHGSFISNLSLRLSLQLRGHANRADGRPTASVLAGLGDARTLARAYVADYHLRVPRDGAIGSVSRFVLSSVFVSGTGLLSLFVVPMLALI